MRRHLMWRSLSRFLPHFYAVGGDVNQERSKACMILCVQAELRGGESDAEHLPPLSYSAAERINSEL